MSRPVRSADISELRAFCTAVDLGSLGRAARLLRVSQPALSKRLRGLEALAGARLLDRSSRGVSPTPEGTRLYAEARKLLVQAEVVEGLLGGLTGSEALVRLAASHTIAEFVLPSPLVSYESRPDRHLSVELLIANSGVVRELVREGRAEFGIAAVEGAPSEDERLRRHPYCDDEVVAAVPQGHPWAARHEEIPIEEFLATPMVVRDPGADTRRAVEAVLLERELTIAPPLAEVGSTVAAKRAAQSECAPVLLSRFAIDGLVRCCVRGLRFPRRFCLLLPVADAMTPAARALVDHLLEHAPITVGSQGESQAGATESDLGRLP